MARLDKMSIQGIRSFGPSDGDKQLVTFYTPLTLILGQNGCGKTTIIEALKYALTGEFPPGARQGHAFIHDPKLSNLAETRAKVVVQLKDMKGDKLQITRLAQLNQGPKVAKFKSLDATISRLKPGEEKAVSISGRCVDVNVEITVSLGVSKPILNSVVFCHQEESLWPLDEGKKVKERFDEIFDATRYNKYLEIIHVKRKCVNEDLKILNNDIGHLKDVIEELNSKRRDKDDNERRINVNRDQIDKLKTRIKPITDRLEVLHKQECNIMRYHTEREKKKAVLDSLLDQQRELRQKIPYEFEGSLEDLNEAMSSFKVQVQEKKQRLADYEERVTTLNTDEIKVQKSINEEQVALGQLQKEDEQQHERIQSRNINLNKLAEALHVTESQQFSERDVIDTLGQLNRNMRKEEDDLDDSKMQYEREENSLQAKIDSFRDRKVSLDQQITMKRRQLREIKEEERKTQSNIEYVDSSASKMKQIEAKLDKVKQELEELLNAVDADSMKAEVERNLIKRERVEQRLEEVNKEVQKLQLQSSLQKELDMIRERKYSREAEIRKFKSKHEDQLKQLLKKIPDLGLKAEFQLCLHNLANDIKDLEKKKLAKEREVQTLEINRKHLKDKLRSKEEEFRAKEELIYKACRNQDYDEVVEKTRKTLEDLQDLKATLSSSEHLNRRYILKLQQSDPCCPLCHRGFDYQTDVMELINELSSKVREIPAQIRENEERLQQEQKRYVELLELKSTYNSLATLRDTEIPNLKLQLEQTEMNIDSARKELEELEMSLAEPKSFEEMAKNMQPDIILWDQHVLECSKLQRDIQKLESRLPDGGSSRSLEEALSEQEQFRDEVTEIRQAVESAQRRLSDHNEQVHSLREEKNKLSEELLKIQSGVQKRKQLEDKLVDLKNKEEALSAELEPLQQELSSAQKEFENATKTRNEVKNINKEKLRVQEKRIAQLKQQLEELRSLQKKIEDFERRRISDKIERAKQTIQDLEKEKNMILSRKKEAALKIDGIKTDLSKQEMKERELDDNLKLRTKRQEEKVVRRQIEDLNSKLGDLNYERLPEEKRNLKKEEESINKEIAEIEGRMQELIVNVSSLQIQLNKPLYKTAEEKYFQKVISKKVMEETVKDLANYAKAMEWSLLHFHTERMKNINRIIRELWRQIYRGNDIDYIEIKTDMAEQTNSDKRRTYNYQVVQIKNDVELEMRGRCSAGQKVLACLIIRMALAETFSANCGVLTLDEPTTNLDSENIESLSIALADIINSRLTQKSFQLLLITHDETFLDRLSKVQNLEYYLKITRDADGKSLVRRRKIDR